MSTPEKIKCRMVVITVTSKTGLKSLIAPPPLKNVAPENHYKVGNKKELKQAFEQLKEGDILVMNAHANQDYFIYGKSKNKVYWSDDQGRQNPWRFLGIEKPPKLAALVLASCMMPEKGPGIEIQRMRQIRAAFHTKIIVTPHKTYQNDKKDHKTLEAILADIQKFYRGDIDGPELNERINRKQGRLRVSFGCNGYHHPDGCLCHFGPRWKE